MARKRIRRRKVSKYAKAIHRRVMGPRPMSGAEFMSYFGESGIEKLRELRALEDPLISRFAGRK